MVTAVEERFYVSVRIPMAWVDHSRAPLEWKLKDKAPKGRLEVVRKQADAKAAENFEAERSGVERVARHETTVADERTYRFELRVGYRGTRKAGGREQTKP